MAAAKVLHFRHQGESKNIPLKDLNFEENASDKEVKKAVAEFLDLGEATLSDLTLVRHQNGNMTLHPEATFGH